MAMEDHGTPDVQSMPAPVRHREQGGAPHDSSGSSLVCVAAAPAGKQADAPCLLHVDLAVEN